MSIERRVERFLWDDPRVVLDDDVSSEAFRRAMSAFQIGSTFKITGADRHAVADALLVDNVVLAGAVILDIGASDGSTSVDLIRKLPEFTAYVIADLGMLLTAARVGRRTLFFDHEGTCILVAGRRVVGWPKLSQTLRLMYWPLVASAGRHPEHHQPLLMLNPAARELRASDPRVFAAVHDVFTKWQGLTPDIIKVANLLRRLYFDDETLLAGLRAVLQSLPEGGHFLLVDNPRAKGVGPRAGLYRREGDEFCFVAQTADSPEIADLVSQARLGRGSPNRPLPEPVRRRGSERFWNGIRR